MSQANVKKALLTTIDNLKANPSTSSVVFRADTKWVSDTLCTASIRDFDGFAVDEPPELGGKDSAANPVELVLAALGTCQEIMYAAYASVMDIKLDSVKVEVRGYLDLKGLFGMDKTTPPGFKRISFDTNITSDASDDALVQLIDTVENHCPVLDILCRAQEISGTASVNGKQLATLSKKAA